LREINTLIPGCQVRFIISQHGYYKGSTGKIKVFGEKIISNTAVYKNFQKISFNNKQTDV